MVLIHGLAQTAWAWAPVARRLSATVRVVAPDLRGHGLSDSPTHGYDRVTLPADILAVIDGAGERPAGTIVAGHGFGAVVAAWTGQALGTAVAASCSWTEAGRTYGPRAALSRTNSSR